MESWWNSPSICPMTERRTRNLQHVRLVQTSRSALLHQWWMTKRSSGDLTAGDSLPGLWDKIYCGHSPLNWTEESEEHTLNRTHIQTPQNILKACLIVIVCPPWWCQTLTGVDRAGELVVWTGTAVNGAAVAPVRDTTGPGILTQYTLYSCTTVTLKQQIK